MSSSASLATGYVPPFAQGTAAAAAATTAAVAAGAAGSGGTSISFASVARTATATGSGSSSNATPMIVNQSGGVDSSSLLQYFTIPYIDAHTLSLPSWRYAYFLWFIVVGLLVIWSVAYQFSGNGTGRIGAWFRKWSIKRIVIGKGGYRTSKKTNEVKRKKVFASPTYAQMLTIAALVGIACALSFAGYDYISPTECTFGGTCPYQGFGFSNGPPPSTYTKRAVPFKRADKATEAITAAVPVAVEKRGVNNPNGWAPYNDPLLSSSNVPLKNSWSEAARLGLIAFAMFPLAVSLALKQWPFNIWATPFLTNYHFDKTAILHRWSGRVIWAFSTGHTIAWTNQLFIDKDPFGRPVFVPVWQYWRFVAGCVAYFFLCLLVILSFKPFRTRYYEFFYWSHVVLVILFLVSVFIHGHALMWWGIAALALWGAERLTRFVVWLYINKVGFVKRKPSSSSTAGGSFTMIRVEKVHSTEGPRSTYPPNYHDTKDEFRRVDTEKNGVYNYGPGHDQSFYDQSAPHARPSVPMHRQSSGTVATHSDLVARIPPGYALAQLLPGKTVRLTLRTPRRVKWKPGQHVLLNVPSVALFQTHPYTICSIDENAPGIAPIGGAPTEHNEVVMLVRAQKGFSKKLYDHVVRLKRRRDPSDSSASPGVLLRSLIGWPMGSAARTSWQSYESLLIVSGGTGVTFGLACLEYVCRRMARRATGIIESKKESEFKTKRVRFVWVLREYSHLSWISTALRRCLEMVDSSQLQVDLCVSRDQPTPSQHHRQRSDAPSHDTTLVGGHDLSPPKAPFARSVGPSRSSSMDSLRDDGYYSDNDLSKPASPQFDPVDLENAQQIDSVTDLVLFEGEEERETYAEREISSQIRKQGKLRRARSRKSYGIPAQQPPVPPVKQTPYGRDFSSRSTTKLYEGSHADASFMDLSSNFPYENSQTDLISDPFAHTGAGAGNDANSSMHRLVGSNGSKGRRDMTLDLSEEEQADLNVVAELARPGQPKFDKILDDEIARSAGRTIVACCGPVQMNTMMRDLVSSRIDLKRVAKGDPKGQVALVCEDFSF